MTGDPEVYPNYSYEYLKAHPEARAAAKLDFIRSLDNTQDGRNWQRGVQRAKMQEQQIRPRRSKFVEVNDERQTAQNPNSRALNVPLKDGRPDFSNQGYLSTLQEKEKSYGDSVAGGGHVETAADYMAEGANVANRAHYRVTTSGQDFYLTQYQDKSYEIRTRSGQIVHSGSYWGPAALEDAQYKLSGDYLWDKKNRPLDYTPPTLQGKQIRILDDGRGPVQVDSTHAPTKEAYRKAILAGFGGTGGGSTEAAADFMGEGLSRGAAVQSRKVWLSEVPSNNPDETVYRRLYMSDYGDQGAELRTAGGQIVLSSGSNDPALIEQALATRPVNASQGSRVYDIAPTPTPRADPVVEATPTTADTQQQTGPEKTDWISQQVDQSLGFLQGLDQRLPKASPSAQIGFVSAMPGGIANPANALILSELSEHPTETFIGGAILGGYGLYEMGKAAVTDPVGSVVRLPQTVPAAIAGTAAGLSTKPVQTITSLYVGGKILSLPGKGLAKVRTSSGTPKTYEPIPEPELVEAPEGFHPFSGGYPTMEKAWVPPRTVTIADDVIQQTTTPKIAPEVLFKEPNKAILQAEAATDAKIAGQDVTIYTKPISVEFDAAPAIATRQALQEVRTTAADGAKTPVYDISTETTHTSSIPFVRESGYVVEDYSISQAGRIEKSARFTRESAPRLPESEITLRDYINDQAVREAQRCTRFANREMVREFGPDILKAEHIHYGPLEQVRSESPMMPEDWGRLITPGNVPIREHIRTQYPDMVDIINMDKAVKVGKYEGQIPESARSYDVPYMHLDLIRNPDTLYNTLTGEFKTTYKKSTARKSRKSKPMYEGLSEREAAMQPVRDQHPRIKIANIERGKTGTGQEHIGEVMQPAKATIKADKILQLDPTPKPKTAPRTTAIGRGLTVLGATVGAIAPKTRTTSAIRQGQISMQQTAQALRQHQGQAYRQVQQYKPAQTADRVMHLTVMPVVKSAQQSKREEKILLLDRTKTDVMQDQRQSMQSLTRQIQRPRMRKPAREKVPKRTTGAGARKGDGGIIPDDLVSDISESLDIRVINPRVTLKELRS